MKWVFRTVHCICVCSTVMCKTMPFPFCLFFFTYCNTVHTSSAIEADAMSHNEPWRWIDIVWIGYKFQFLSRTIRRFVTQLTMTLNWIEHILLYIQIQMDWIQVPIPLQNNKVFGYTTDSNVSMCMKFS